MSQHRDRVKFKRPIDGVHASHCGRFLATHDKSRACPTARWTLVDLEMGREVFCAALLKECKLAAQEIDAAPASVHPCAAARQLDAEWRVDVAARPGPAYDAGDLVAWSSLKRSVLPLEPHNTVLARYRARRLAMIEQRRELNAEIVRELVVTDKPGPSVSSTVVVEAVTFRQAVRTKRQRETEDRSTNDSDEDRRGELVVVPPSEGEIDVREVPRAWREHALRLRVAPLPHQWVDLVFVDVGVRYGVKVHIRDNDTKRDVWRRCRHAIREVSSAA